MYEPVFQLKRQPFSAGPNPEHYFPARSSQLALAQCKLAIDRGNGPAVVIGGGGLGKTLLLGLLADDYGDQYRLAQIPCSRLDTRLDLLQALMFSLKQPFRDMAEGELRLAFTEFLRPHEGCPNGVLLLVDDAHWLNSGLLDELRILSGISYHGQMRCHLVLTGNRGLEEMLMDPQNGTLNQRLAARGLLQPLTSSETAEYVRSHLRRAGAGQRQFFTDSALQKIHSLSNGNPRLINQLCDAALIACALQRSERVDDTILLKAWQEIEHFPGNWPAPAATSRPEAAADSSDILEFGVLEAEPHNIQPEKTPTHLGTTRAREARPSEIQRARDEDADCCGLAPQVHGKMAQDFKASCDADVGYRIITDLDKPGSTTSSVLPTSATPTVSLQWADRLVENPFSETFASEEPVNTRVQQDCQFLNQKSGTLKRAEVERPLADISLSVGDPSESLINQVMAPDTIIYESSADITVPVTPATSSGIWGSDPFGKRIEPSSEGNLSPRSEAIARMRMETVSVPFQSTLPMGEQAPVATPRDDRDILIVNRPVAPPPSIPQTPEDQLLEQIEDELASLKPMKGRAIRLEYRELFKQLRQSETY